MEYRAPVDVSLRDSAYSGMRRNVIKHWKHAWGLLTVSAFTCVMFFAIHSYWLRVLLSVYGLTLGVFWGCLNFPPRDFTYDESTKFAESLGLWLSWWWVLLSTILNTEGGFLIAIWWCFCISKYLVSTCFSSLESIASMSGGILMLTCSVRVHRKALAAESSLLRELSVEVRRR